MKIAILFTAISIGLASGSKASFERLDDVVLADGVIHVAVDMNLTAVRHEVHTLSSYISSTFDLHNSTRSALVAALLTDAAIAQKSLEEEINAIFSTSIGDDRGRRSPQNEIGKLVGGAFGLVTQEQANAIIDAVNAGATATNHIIDHLGSDETRLAATTNDVRFLNRSIHYLAHTLQNGQSETRMVAQAIRIAGYQARTRSKVHRAQAALHGPR